MYRVQRGEEVREERARYISPPTGTRPGINDEPVDGKLEDDEEARVRIPLSFLRVYSFFCFSFGFRIECAGGVGISFLTRASRCGTFGAGNVSLHAPPPPRVYHFRGDYSNGSDEEANCIRHRGN